MVTSRGYSFYTYQGLKHINVSKQYDHPGFPEGAGLQCPVFTQDKYKYLSALMPKGMCNPTFKVDFLPTMDYYALEQELKK